MTNRYFLKKMQYIIMRNAIPLNSKDRRAFEYGPKVFANSIPKAGTNLLKRVINLLPYMAPKWSYHLDHSISGYLNQLYATRKGQMITAHLAWSQHLADILKNHGFHMFIIIRDIRDIAVSNVFYLKDKDPTHRLHDYFNLLKSDEERLTASIAGIDGRLLKDGIRSKSIGEHAESFLPWLKSPNCLVVRFEDIIGSSGGGSESRQLFAIQSIINHLGIEVSGNMIQEIADKAFYKDARTFRKGQIGDWKNHFNEEHKRIFKETAGNALIKMGYEDGYDW